MGPPCEHGGRSSALQNYRGQDIPSMGPPCEHGGRDSVSAANVRRQLLQWGRRVNTAEG